LRFDPARTRVRGREREAPTKRRKDPLLRRKRIASLRNAISEADDTAAIKRA